MAVADHILTDLPYADASRMTAAGGSYGGYMIDWMLGHTQRFKALISHAGVYDLERVRRHRGAVVPVVGIGGTPWDKPETTAKWSPNNYVKDFHTPTLVVAASWISACRTTRAWSSSPHCKCRKFRPNYWSSR